MKLAVYRPLWGVAKQAGGHLALPDAFRAIAKLGYAGVECPVGLALHYGAQQFKALLAENKLGWSVRRGRAASNDIHDIVL